MPQTQPTMIWKTRAKRQDVDILHPIVSAHLVGSQVVVSLTCGAAVVVAVHDGLAGRMLTCRPCRSGH